ncbi:ficolin-1-like [Drosophila elegans]|uniref:ficolin-1-like n=1 Tax=Drosophila elegans TaxID=30023 RepID=UPI0007E6DE70|nr:ficolin-1-like [Drosophila elegans]
MSPVALDNFSKDSVDPLICEIRLVKRPGIEDFEAAFEDLPSAGPGWMVIQRRIDGLVPFNSKHLKHDYCYRNGFGNLGAEFWLGCERLHKLTTSGSYELYIHLVDFDDSVTFAKYDNFVVGSEDEGYVIKSLGAYSGNAGDAMSTSVNCKFLHEMTYYGCYGKIYHWSWWKHAQCNLNGFYHKTMTLLSDINGVWWGYKPGNERHSLKSCKMLIRPKMD